MEIEDTVGCRHQERHNTFGSSHTFKQKHAANNQRSVAMKWCLLNFLISNADGLVFVHHEPQKIKKAIKNLLGQWQQGAKQILSDSIITYMTYAMQT